MSTHRNDPCPCGSGKKYKRCCMAADEKMERTLRLVGDDEGHPRRRSDLAGHDIGTVWQADLAPINTRFRDDLSARPAIAMVMAGDVLLHADMISHPPAEYDEVAALLDSALRSAAEAARMEPTAVQLRYAEVARSLTDRLKPRGTAVHSVKQLPLLDNALDDFNKRVVSRDAPEGFAPPPPGIRVSSPVTWAGWGLPASQIARLFAAGASYYRAAPWRELANEEYLHAQWPDGGSWMVSVLGYGGMEFGLSLYASHDELPRQSPGEPDPLGLADAREAVLSFTFDDADFVGRAAVREIRAARWEVAGKKAYPFLMVFNTPGGGVTSRQMEDLTTLLTAIPRFVDRYRAGLEGHARLELPMEFTDAETGIVLRYEGVARDYGEADSLWGIPTQLEPGFAQGASAEPGITFGDIAARAGAELDEGEINALVQVEMDVIGRFAVYLKSGIGGKRLSAATVEKHVQNTEIFVDFLASFHGIPLRAVTEYDLRVFLYDWFPRKIRTSRTHARSIPVSLRRFLEYLASFESIECPWADSILRDTDSYMERWDSFPGGFFWDADVKEWQSELYLNLYARVLLHEARVPGEHGVEWGGGDGLMGILESELDTQLLRLWLEWREEEILRGNAAPGSVRAALIPKQREWEQTPNELAHGATPADAIARERAERARRWPDAGKVVSSQATDTLVGGDVDVEIDEDLDGEIHGEIDDLADEAFDDLADQDLDDLSAEDLDDAIGRLVDKMRHDPELHDKSESLRESLSMIVGENVANNLADELVGAAGAPMSGLTAGAGANRSVKRTSGNTGKSKRATDAPVTFQLHVSLVGIEPPIWRRIQVQGDVELERLHEIVQVAMGWEDVHPYTFRFDDDIFGPETLEIDGIHDSWETALVELGLVPGSVIRYTYDLGDRWQHELRVESVGLVHADTPKARCLAGERACPPENCGGVPGYEELMKTISDPSHPRIPVLENLLELGGRAFDPELFDVEAVNDALRHGW